MHSLVRFHEQQRRTRSCERLADYVNVTDRRLTIGQDIDAMRQVGNRWAEHSAE